MKTVEFIKRHVYGGHTFEKSDKLECPEYRAKALEKAGVVKKEAPRKASEKE